MRILPRALPAAAACLLAGAALTAAGASAEPVGQVEHFPTGCGIDQLVPGPDGNIWFTCFRENPVAGGRGKVGRITPQGTVTEFGAGIAPNSEPGGIVAGPDGNLWFTINGGANLLPRQQHRAAIGRVTPAGTITVFSAGLGKRSVLGGLIVGPDGNLWFIDGGAHAIGRITPQGAIAEFPTHFRDGIVLGGPAAGADGNLWATEFFGLPRLPGDPPVAQIVRITPAGAITEFGSVPDTGVGFPGAPVAGPDGNVWFIGNSPRPAIDRITPTGAITESAPA